MPQLPSRTHNSRTPKRHSSSCTNQHHTKWRRHWFGSFHSCHANLSTILCWWNYCMDWSERKIETGFEQNGKSSGKRPKKEHGYRDANHACQQCNRRSGYIHEDAFSECPTMCTFCCLDLKRNQVYTNSSIRQQGFGQLSSDRHVCRVVSVPMDDPFWYFKCRAFGDDEVRDCPRFLHLSFGFIERVWNCSWSAQNVNRDGGRERFVKKRYVTDFTSVARMWFFASTIILLQCHQHGIPMMYLAKNAGKLWCGMSGVELWWLLQWQPISGCGCFIQ